VKPNFIGIGVQKCATSWLYRLLEGHPDAGITEPKELDFFSYFYGFGFQWYERFFEACESKLAIGEISPSYFVDLAVPERVKAYNPEIRVVLALRDPVERAYSNHLHEIRIGHLRGSDLSFEFGLQNNPTYLEQSFYSNGLRAWLKAFPKDQIAIFLQEDIKERPLEEAQRFYRFLGIDESYESLYLGQRANESAIPKYPAIKRSLQALGAMGRTVGLTPIVESVRDSELVRQWRSGMDVNLRDLVPAIRPETTERLHQTFAQDVLEVARLLGRDRLPWPTWEYASAQEGNEYTVLDHEQEAVSVGR